MSVAVVEVVSGRLVQRLGRHERPVLGIATAHGVMKALATGSEDRQVVREDAAEQEHS